MGFEIKGAQWVTEQTIMIWENMVLDKNAFDVKNKK